MRLHHVGGNDLNQPSEHTTPFNPNSMNHRPHLCIGLLGFALFALVGTAGAQGVIPPEMERLRSSYETARLKATRPLDEKYLGELLKLQDSYTRAAKLEQAVIVANEVKRLRAHLGVPQDQSAPPLAPAPLGVAGKVAATQGAEVIIPANSPNGLRLGSVKRGDSITLQYVSGLWKAHGGIATENPDSAKAKDDDRLVIAEPANENGDPGKVIWVVPADTATQPTTYSFQTTREDVVLRIHSNSQRKENPGHVTYIVKLVR
jgi:hypothetical protein